MKKYFMFIFAMFNIYVINCTFPYEEPLFNPMIPGNIAIDGPLSYRGLYGGYGAYPYF